jgi:hypothetical protein
MPPAVMKPAAMIPKALRMIDTTYPHTSREAKPDVFRIPERIRYKFYEKTIRVGHTPSAQSTDRMNG